MKILITYPSALEFWLSYDPSTPLVPADLNCSNIPTDVKIRKQMIHECQKLGLSHPFHVLVPDRTKRNRGSAFICHTITNQLPAQSVIHLSEHIDIISPEFCYLLAAHDMTVSELAVLATDLLGDYRLDPSAKFGLSKRNPITSKVKLSSYIANISRVKGIKKARAAIKYAYTGSCSPVESKIAVVASLPCLYGGYGLPRAELNALISLTQDAAKLLSRSTCCCDLVWPKQHFVVEYDSDLVHSSPKQVRYDKRRSDAVCMSGFSLLHVTKDYFSNQNTIDELFEIIRKGLGVRSNKKMLEKYKDIHFEVIKRLFLMLPNN